MMTDDSFQSNIECVSLGIHPMICECLFLGFSEVSESTENVSFGIHFASIFSEHFVHQAESESS